MKRQKRDRVVRVVFTCLLKCGQSTNATVQKRAESRLADLIPNTGGYEVLNRSVKIENPHPPQKSRADRLSDAADLINQGVDDAAGVLEELETWKEGMSGTNLESTEKYSTLDSAVDAIRDALTSSAEDASSSLGDVEIPGMFG